MVGIMLTSILSLQSNIYSRVVFNARRIERLLPLKEMLSSVLIEPLKEGERTREQINQDTAMTMVYKKEVIKPESSLVRFKRLFSETVTGSWDEWKGPQTMDVTHLLFVPEKPQEQEQGDKQ